MNATTTDTTTPSNVFPLFPDRNPEELRRTLDAVYRERYASLFELARRTVRKDEDASDAVHDAFVHVLERPPHDLSKPALTLVLEGAVRAACERGRRNRRDEAAMKIGLRKRFPL
jgi:DNA-directed RNA polymerase specialized sigma24 family protein